MKAAFLLLLFTIALAGCVRSGKPGPEQPKASQSVPSQTTGPGTAQPPAVAESVIYVPRKDRVLTRGDGPGGDMSWQPLGISFSSLPGEPRSGLAIAEAPLMDADHIPTGSTLSTGARVSILDASSPWESTGNDYRNHYRIRHDPGTGPAEAWVDASSVALIITEAEGITAGVVLRKIGISGGESEFNLLAIAQGATLTLVDTSFYVFPDAFHPSGVVRLSVSDLNADSLPEMSVEGETIVSLRYLGATALRWVAWLRPTEGLWKPIFIYNQSFATDEGYSYTATARAFSSTGSGTVDMIRVNTDYLIVSDQQEFRTTVVSFYPRKGSEYRKASLEDLPKQGSVSTDEASLLGEPSTAATAAAAAEAVPVATLRRGELLFVFDRSDTRKSAEDAASWWYKAVTKSGAEGWINGDSITLSWIDPMTVNREAFLGTGGG